MKKFTHIRQDIPLNAKRIPSLPGYWATPEGDIMRKGKGGNPEWRNERTPVRIVELSQNSVSNSGYKLVQPYDNGKKLVVYVHKLIAEAFLGPRPEGLVIDHIDRDKWNNAASNLRYVTVEENAANTVKEKLTYATGRKQHKEYDKNMTTLGNKYGDEIIRLRDGGMTYQEIADTLKIGMTTVYNFLRSS